MSRLKNLIRNINYLTKNSLWDRREEDIVYLTKKILDDGFYEYGIEPYGVPLRILDSLESLRLLEEQPKSLIRTGDGEIKLMMGQDQPFQRYEKEVAEKLIETLEHPRDDIYVGINRNYFIPLLPKGSPFFYQRYAYDFRCFYRKYLNPDAVYLDATMTSYEYVMGQEYNDAMTAFFNRWRNLFSGKNLVIVCGDHILDKLEFDIFDLAKTKQFIHGPRLHAWDKYEQITHQIRSYNADEVLVVFILGMAGKAMIPELTNEGYLCWDVGHLAKYYDAYMKKIPGTTENQKKFYAPD